MVKKKPEACLFCGCTPCECDGAKPKKKAAPRKSNRSEPPVAPPASDLDFATVEPETRFKAQDKPERDLVLMNALRVLYDIVSDRDRRWIDTQLSPPYPQALDRRIAEWKAKHSQ